MAPRAFLCDFDGTISPHDLGHAFVERYAVGGEARLEALANAWRAGTLGHRELTEAECALLRCSEDEARGFTAGFAIDPGFALFARGARSRGDAVTVLSEGFDFYIRALLEREGLGWLEVRSNRVRFERGGVIPEFPYAALSCGRCGNCKAAHVRDWRARGYRTVLIGDGYSDRCGAREADVVLAQGALETWCECEGVAFERFTSFEDVLSNPALEALA